MKNKKNKQEIRRVTSDSNKQLILWMNRLEYRERERERFYQNDVITNTTQPQMEENGCCNYLLTEAKKLARRGVLFVLLLLLLLYSGNNHLRLNKAKKERKCVSEWESEKMIERISSHYKITVTVTAVFLSIYIFFNSLLFCRKQN